MRSAKTQIRLRGCTSLVVGVCLALAHNLIGAALSISFKIVCAPSRDSDVPTQSSQSSLSARRCLQMRRLI